MKNIYVFDMGNVIIKPANLRKMYNEADTNCSYEEFKILFYSSKEANDVYKGLITDDEYFDYVRIKSGSSKTVEELKKLYLDNKGGIYEDTINLIKKIKEKWEKSIFIIKFKRY